MRRSLLTLLAGLVTVLAVAGPAAAVGVDGVDLSPVLRRGGDGRPVLELGTEPTTAHAQLRNLSGEARTVRVYAVGAEASDGRVTLLGPGTADWLSFPEQSVELAPGEERLIGFTVDPRRVPETAGHIALVIESGSGSTLVKRAAVTIRISAQGVFGSPKAPFVVAGLLILLLAVAHLIRRRLVAPADRAPQVRHLATHGA